MSVRSGLLAILVLVCVAAHAGCGCAAGSRRSCQPDLRARAPGRSAGQSPGFAAAAVGSRGARPARRGHPEPPGRGARATGRARRRHRRLPSSARRPAGLQEGVQQPDPRHGQGREGERGRGAGARARRRRARRSRPPLHARPRTGGGGHRRRDGELPAGAWRSRRDTCLRATTSRSCCGALIGCPRPSTSCAARWTSRRVRRSITRSGSSTGTRAISTAPRVRFARRSRVQADHADAHVALGAVLEARHDWAGAARSLRAATALRPGASTVHYTLARVLQQQGDARGARAAFDEAERLRLRGAREQEATVLTAVGASRLASGDSTGALTLFQRATTVLDDYAPAHYQLGLRFRAAWPVRRGARRIRTCGSAEPCARPSRRPANSTTEILAA